MEEAEIDYLVLFASENKGWLFSDPAKHASCETLLETCCLPSTRGQLFGVEKGRIDGAWAGILGVWLGELIPPWSGGG